MPDTAPTSERCILRLAEGVRRPRLIDPVLAARPPLVVVSAPSGYGKTVLAAQIASAGVFHSTYWVTSNGGADCAEDDLGVLAARILGACKTPGPRSGQANRRACHDALSGVPDDRPVLIVFDDAAWAGDAEALEVLEMAISEAPLGSLALVTTRAETSDPAILRNAWVLGLEQLRLTDQELGDIWARHAGASPREDVVADLALATGRHAALLSLMARNASLMGLSSIPPQIGASVTSLVDGLAASQLDALECDILDYAAILGQGDLTVLVQLCPNADPQLAMNRIARVIPLVSVSGEGNQERFIVHDLVAEARGSARALANRCPSGLAAAIELIASDGRHARALDVSIRSGSAEVLSASLRVFGSRMLGTASWELVRAALDAIGAAAVAADSGLLAIRAETDWALGKRTQAIQEARLAVRMEELAGGSASRAAAHALLAGMRMAVADFAGIASDVKPLLEQRATMSPDDEADLLYVAVAAFAFQADVDAWRRCTDSAMHVLGASNASPLKLSRLDSVLAMVAGVVEGDPEKANRLFRRAASRAGVPSHWGASVTGNAAAALLEAGDTLGASKALEEASRCLGVYCTSLDYDLRRLVADTARALAGEGDLLRDRLESAAASCEAESERFTLVMTCLNGAPVAVAMRDFAYALSLSERGLSAAIETGSPVLTWLAELVQALASLASGDTDRARSTAARILPQAEAISAMALVLHAHLILAEVAVGDDDLSLAVHHLSAVSDHIISKSPALVVACYLRAFPDLLGPLALAMGVDAVPIRVLNLLSAEYRSEALGAAASVLTKTELNRLKGRVRKEEEAVAARDRAARDIPALCDVRLFGGLQVTAPHGAVGERDWTKRKARLLFAMLVSRGGTDVPRGEIIEYLWPHMDEERGLSNFYVVWSAMKRALSPGGMGEPASPFVEHVHGVCRVVQGRVVSDLDRFRDALSRARTAHAAGEPGTELPALLEAIEMYRGDVLPGDVYDDWFGPVRERFKNDYEDTALRAGRLYAEAGEALEGLAILRAASTHNPWREDLYQAILRLQIATGQRAAAIETYLLCRSRLVEDLGIDPSRETTALYETVLGMDE